MIEVTVRWFAAYRDLTGVGSETIETEAGTPAQLFDELTERHESLGRRDSALVAINDEMADWTAPLTAGDVVLFFPPVAGG
jgi:MoaD family protein